MWIVFGFIPCSIEEFKQTSKSSLIVFWGFPGWKKVWSPEFNILMFVMSCLSKKNLVGLGSTKKDGALDLFEGEVG